MRYAWALLLIGCAHVAPQPQTQVVKIFAERFQFTPAVVHLRAGVPVVFELSATDHKHGFSLTQVGLRADIVPGEVSRVEWVMPVAGHYEFHCDIFCGDGHEDMSGEIVVE